MSGLIWIAMIWSATLYVMYTIGRRNGRRWPLSPFLTGCLLLLLIGHNSTGEPSTSNSIDLHTLIRGGLASAALTFAIRALLVNRQEGRVARQRRSTNMLLLGSYAGYALFSTIYSAAPLHTLGKAYELGVGLIVVWAIATSRNAPCQLRAAINLIVSLWASMLVVAIVGFFVLPSQFALAGDPRPGFIFPSPMAAPYAHSNGLSAIGAIVAAYAIARALSDPARSAQRWWFALGGVASLGIVLASGRQGVIIWSVALAITLYRFARPALVFAVIPLTAFLVGRWSDLLWSTLTRDQGEAVLYSLSGRLNFWDAALSAWWENPLIGYGFGAGGRFVALRSLDQDFLGSLHSGYFEALIGVGIVGVVPLLAVVLRVAAWSGTRLMRGLEPHVSILIVPMILHTGISLGFGAWLTSEFLMLALLASYSDRVRLMPRATPAQWRPAIVRPHHGRLSGRYAIGSAPVQSFDAWRRRRRV